mmetsp:Transcript_16713/g.27925  ORF Transcript_16713/g.27925 Transcript_16713/m.27925 type:complete len:450 (+) Transcript_16713:51-1400(+)
MSSSIMKGLAASALLASQQVAASIPVFVMLPLDVISNDGSIKNVDSLSNYFNQLRGANVEGVMADCWWGIAERQEKNYDFSAYEQMTQMAKDAGLKMQFVMSFHQCGGNVGDTCDIPLPSWVLDSSQDIFYQDQHGNIDREVISLFADTENVVGQSKRSPLNIYKDFMTAFKSALGSHVGSTISEIQVGAGPCGELRYPSYQMDKWSFCGVGEFQSYNSYAMTQLSSAATAVGHPEWANSGGPSNAGSYNSVPSETGFFGSNDSENFRSDYGKFYLEWYSSALVAHGQDMLTQANDVFGNSAKLAVKVAGIHWWYLDDSHAAELTAGYYNIDGQKDIYYDLASMFTSNNATFDFTCLEMKDNEQPSECKCGPYELVQHTKQATKDNKGHYSGENALQRYDTTAYDTIKSQATSLNWNIDAMTYLRLTDDLMSGSNWDNFKHFVNDMNSM